MKSTRIQPLVIAIVGGSGAGKTWLADQIELNLRVPTNRLCQDDFYRDLSHLPPKRRTRVNFDNPRAIEWGLLEQVLRNCIAGLPVKVPLYDFCTHCRKSSCRTLEPRPLLIVDGLWLLRRRSLRNLFSLTIYVDCSSRTRLKRRLARDIAWRGRTKESVRKQFLNTVEPMHTRYVESQKMKAGIILREPCTSNEMEAVTARIKNSLAAKNGSEL